MYDQVVEPLGVGIARQLVPEPAYQGSMEMPGSPSEGEETYEGFVGYPTLPRGIIPQPQPPWYGEQNRTCECLSRRDWYDMLLQATQEGVPSTIWHKDPRHVPDAWVPPCPSPITHLAKMQDLQGEGSDCLDA